ncbi:MAG: lysophospholipid acyltransferase family protein [Candidatus Omnitrophica bacterium]|nr:lysophospholipid acyltransferase family protein [Candidatus Omnitrophota bacterium]
MGNYYLYRIGKFLARILPLGVSNALVMALCDLHYFFSKADRQAVENNLKLVSKTDHVPKAQVRAVFRGFGKYLLEFFTMTKRLRPEFIKSNVHIKNIEYLNEVLQKGKGAILVSAHVGNWEMGGAILPILGFPLSVVALAHKDKRVNALFNTQREAFGCMVIQADVAVRRIVEHLQRNRLVAILGDRDFGKSGIVMDFLGQKTMIPKGAAFFSLKTGTPIVPIFFIRQDKDNFEINIYPPIEPPQLPDTKITHQTASEYIYKYLMCIEAEIRKNPSQWLLFREFAQ